MNNRKVIYTEDFRNAIKEINRKQYYIQKDFYSIVQSKIENLKVFPQMYPKLKNYNCHKISVKDYIILYEIQKNIIYIVNIIPTKSKHYNHLY